MTPWLAAWVHGGVPAAWVAITCNAAALSVDRTALVAALREQKPDVVCLQEMDVNTVRSGPLDQPTWLARQLGMHATVGTAMPFDGGTYGVALLTRAPLEKHRTHALPRLGTEEPRVALEAQVQTDGRPLRVLCTHLAANWKTRNPDAIRAAQARALRKLLDAERVPTLLLGDFNTAPDTLQPLLGQEAAPLGASPLFTYPAQQPALALDHMWQFPRGAFVATSARAVTTNGSDHLPVVMTLQWAHKP